MFDSDLEAKSKGMTRRHLLLSGSAVLGGLAVWAKFGNGTVVAESRATEPGVVTIVNFSDAGNRIGEVQVPKVIKTDAEWRKQLSSNAYDIARRADTEMAFTGSTWNLHDKGLFRCICCDTALFSSGTKFESGTGWPSFWQPIAKQNVLEKTDSSFGMERTEVACRRCEAHLGHVFNDGPRPTGLRYCMNSASMRFAKQV